MIEVQHQKTDLQLRFVASTNNSVRLAVPFPPQGETVLRYCLRGRVLLHVGYTNDLVTSRKTNRTKIDLLWLSLVLPVYGMCKQNIVKKFGDKSEILISQENAHMPSISDSILLHLVVISLKECVHYVYSQVCACRFLANATLCWLGDAWFL